jgi:hypothetical protein
MEISSTNPVKVQSTPRPAAAAQPATQASPAAAPATPAASVELQGRDLSQASDPKANPGVYSAAPVVAQQASTPRSDAQPVDGHGDPAQPQDAQAAGGAKGEVQASGEHEPPSGLKSFGYGALGVGAPKNQPAANEDDYSAGQWTGAALKVGGIIAILA